MSVTAENPGGDLFMALLFVFSHFRDLSVQTKCLCGYFGQHPTFANHGGCQLHTFHGSKRVPESIFRIKKSAHESSEGSWFCQPVSHKHNSRTVIEDLA